MAWHAAMQQKTAAGDQPWICFSGLRLRSIADNMLADKMLWYAVILALPSELPTTLRWEKSHGRSLF
jgi:hypothetical protein